jgi:fatty-acyl-CoA synthase
MLDRIDYANTTMGDLLDAAATAYPDHDAVVMVDRPYRLSYAELKHTADLLAKGLIRLGVQPGDHVSIWATNVPEYVVLQFAIPKAAAVWVTINIRSLAHEVEYLLEQSDSTTLFLVEGFRDLGYVELLNGILPELPTSTLGQLHGAALPHLRNVVFINRSPAGDHPPGMLTFQDVVDLGREVRDEVLRERQAGASPEDVASIQYTSGTTGSPKGVMLTHRNMVLNAHHTAEAQRITDRDRFVVMGPLYHCAPNVLGTLCAVTRGAATVLIETFDTTQVLESIQREQVTVINGAPTMFVQILQHPQLDQYDRSSLRTGFMASAPCPVELVKQVIGRLGVPEFTICYGLTETSPLITHTYIDAPFEKRVSTVGRALPGVEVRVVDPATGQDVSRGQPGELWACGYVVMKGYYKNPEATARTIVEGGWCRTGDLASMDEDGYVNIRGRLKDVIIRGGENISPVEVENALYEHPKVKECSVIGIPDPRWGEEVIAFVQLTDGATATAEELKAFLEPKLAYYKRPKLIRFLDTFPSVASGKIQKFRLKEMAIAELGLEEAAAVRTA